MTLNELKAAILAAANRVEVEQMLPLHIAMTEAELNRTLRVRQMVGRATATVNGRYELLPEDFCGVRSFELASTPAKALEYVSPDRLSQMAGLHASAAEPIYYSIVGRELRFAPAPAQSYAGSQLTYWKKLPALTDGHPSNWLLEAHPDAYLYGALKHIGQALGDPRSAGWAGMFDAVLKDINSAGQTEERGAR